MRFFRLIQDTDEKYSIHLPGGNRQLDHLARLEASLEVLTTMVSFQNVYFIHPLSCRDFNYSSFQGCAW